jgi:site-specific DNA recombinase
MQIALYARVSTPRQFENALSVPDQLAQMRGWAERNGHVVVKEYIEPGASATDDKRPVFQDMVADATAKPAPFQIIVVHSFSRFFRDMVEAALYQKKLGKNGVKLVSITQHINDDPAGEMQQRIIMLFDEYQSKEIAKHVLRSMQENARQGYFNGAKPPFGYKTVEAGQTGTHGRIKKKLAIKDGEAEIVGDIFALYVEGMNSKPRMGIKEIAKHLNATGVTMRGRSWGIHKVHKILSSGTYAGEHMFNKTGGKLGAPKDKAEWIKVQVPAIIDKATFDKAALLREACSPKKINPRRVSSPTLLTGIIRCGHCGGAMVVATGKSGQYRYYKCSNRMSRGNAACPSGNVPLEKLDNLVLDAFAQRVYTPEHMRGVVEQLRQQASKPDKTGEKQKLKTLETGLLEAEQALVRIYEAVEKGFMEADEHLKARIQQHKTRRENLLAQIAALKQQRQSPLQNLTPRKIDAVARLLGKKLAGQTPVAKAYLQATLDEIRVTDGTVSLTGPNASMAGLIVSNAALDAHHQVPRTMQQWRRG